MVDTAQITQQAWDDFVAQAPSGHLLQSWGWGEFKGRFGWKPLRVAVSREGAVVACAQMLLRRTPLGPMAYVPKGPVLDPADADVAAELLEAMHRAARQHRVVATKVEPDWLDEPQAEAWLQRAGFVSSPQTVQPRRTILLDISASDQDILAAMKSKTRYNVRLAERKGVEIREGNETDIAAFHELMTVTGDRDEFGIHSEAYFRQAWKLFAPAGRAKLLLAIYEGEILAGLMVFALGAKSWYMYGASSNEQRNLMPTYLLQWEAMRWAKEQGCQTYDLFGIPDLEEEVLEAAIKDEKAFEGAPPPLWGVYRHKRGYGGQAIRYVGAYDYVYKAAAYRLLNWALTAWKKLRG